MWAIARKCSHQIKSKGWDFGVVSDFCLFGGGFLVGLFVGFFLKEPLLCFTFIKTVQQWNLREAEARLHSCCKRDILFLETNQSTKQQHIKWKKLIISDTEKNTDHLHDSLHHEEFPADVTMIRPLHASTSRLIGIRYLATLKSNQYIEVVSVPIFSS